MINKTILTHEMLQDTYVCDHFDQAPFWLQLNHFTPIPNLNAVIVIISYQTPSPWPPPSWQAPAQLPAPCQQGSPLPRDQLYQSPWFIWIEFYLKIWPTSKLILLVRWWTINHWSRLKYRELGPLIDDWLIVWLTITESSKVRYGKLLLNCSPWWTECSTFS